MAESLIEQLNQAVEAIFADPDSLPKVSGELQPVIELAVVLRDLPRDGFKAKLRHELIRRTEAMKAASEPQKSDKKADQKSDTSTRTLHTVTPYLAVKEAPALIEFVKEVFGAEGKIYGIGSEGGFHAEYKIGDSIVMIGGGEKWRGTPMPTALHVYVDDVDAVYQRALDAGASSMVEPIEDHGERLAGVKDVSGNEWYIARRLSGSHTDEGLRSVNVYLHPTGAAEMIEFLKPAFGAEEVAVYRQEPTGPVVHAKIRIGDSVVEMGEAHGPYQPMPTMFFLYVDDVDAWHQRAVAAGATSIGEPKNQPYGDRSGGVRDPFGNVWYVASPLAP